MKKEKKTVNVSSINVTVLGQSHGEKALSFPYTLFEANFTATERHYRNNAN